MQLKLSYKHQSAKGLCGHFFHWFVPYNNSNKNNIDISQRRMTFEIPQHLNFKQKYTVGIEILVAGILTASEFWTFQCPIWV